MTQNSSPPPKLILRVTIIGLVIAILATAFAYVGGWLDPGRLTPDQMIDTLEDNAVTIRDRDTMHQARVPASELVEILKDKIEHAW